MAKRKGRKETQQTLSLEDQSGEEGSREDAGFFACYLLTSICPRFKGHTYIGYTLNPRRRIRQHNGEIGSGAGQTKKKRPWEMVLCIYGFPNNIAALQFEWAWQHPLESLAVRVAAASFKSLSGLANKIKLAYSMLTLPPWQNLDLTMNLFSTKYRSYISGWPALPEHMRIRVCSMDDLPCYNHEWDGNECERSLLDSTEGEPTATELKDGSAEENVPHQINHTDGHSFSKEGQGYSFVFNNSPSRESFAFTSSCIVEDKQSPRVVELTREFPEPALKKQSTAALVANKDQELFNRRDIFSNGVEIIDVCTPSPCRQVNSGSKKRMRPTLDPEIIDLTNSPLFV